MNRPPEEYRAEPEAYRAPARQESAVASYLSAIRAHQIVVALITLAAVAASIGFLLTRSDRYEATADLLVNALPQEDVVFFGLPLIRDSGDPVRTVQTAASLVESREAATATAEGLGQGWTADSVLDAIEVAPRGESNVLGITATADDAQEAARLANQFSMSALDARAEEIAAIAAPLIDRLDARVQAMAIDDPARGDVLARRESLRSVLADGDPTLSPSQEAIAPTSAVGAPPAVILALAVLAGFVLGSGTALLLELLARRVRDPEDALDVYPLPVLARIPELSAKRLRGPPGTTWHMPPEIREPFRTLALQLDQRSPSGAVMVTSPSSGDGKTTSAINLAVSLAASGKRVILLDFDLRKPRVAAALGIQGGHSIADILEPGVGLDDLLQSASDLTLRVLPLVASGHEAGLIDAAGPRLPRVLSEAKQLADHVVVDTAPLGEVGDALRLAREVDEVFLVMRPGNTNRAHLQIVRGMFEGVEQTPTGYLILSRLDGSPRGYYAYGRPQ